MPHKKIKSIIKIMFTYNIHLSLNVVSVGHPLQRQVFHWNFTNKEWEIVQDMMPMENLPMLQLRYTALWEIFRLLLFKFSWYPTMHISPETPLSYCAWLPIAVHCIVLKIITKDDDIGCNLTSIQLKKPERINTKMVWLDITVLRIPPVIYTHVYLFQHR